VLDGTIVPNSGSVALANHCLMARVEQHLPDTLLAQPLLQAVLAKLPVLERESQRWQAERLLAEMGFTPDEVLQRASTLSGGQHTGCCLPERSSNRISCCWMSRETTSTCRPSCGWKASCRPGRELRSGVA
jgi:ATPase subunit of ABC transporter with duplicated ATPase domains